jgi:alpha-1,2-glucosyltransferase
VIYDAHSALNISLFPPLFFFSGLYYTDVASTLIVLMNYSAFLQRRKGTFSARDDLILVVLGIVALSFRQTNIFWVAVFPAGLTVIDTLRSMVPITASASTETASAILAQSWSKGRIYDPSVAEAGMKGMIECSPTSVSARIQTAPRRSRRGGGSKFRRIYLTGSRLYTGRSYHSTSYR